MPELPEVEAVARRLRKAAPWSVITDCGQFRPTTMQGGESAVGQRLDAVDRRGKNLILRLSSGDFLRVHLKMTGNLTVIPDWRFRNTTVRAWLALEDGRAVVLDDPRALGRITFHAAGEEVMLFQRLGPEPFSKEFTLDHFIAAAGRSSKPIKLLLMEQRAVVGLGNIYVAEALFQAGIHPARASSGISRKRLARLHGAIGAVLALAMGSAEAAYEKPGGFSEAEVYPVAVYGREGKECPHCKGCVKRIPQGGRSTYYCPKCQK